MLFEDRQRLLKQKWDFTCDCAICQPERIGESDARRKRIREAKRVLSDASGKGASTMFSESVGPALELLRLYDEENLVAPRGKYLEVVAYASSAMGDRVEAEKYAALAAEHWGILAGHDSAGKTKMSEMARDPTRHPSWRLGVKQEKEASDTEA